MSWRFFVDRGGTFTDCVAIPPDGGRPIVRKLLSTDDAPLVAMRDVLGAAEIPACELRLGTTLATNALLERRGHPCALVVTRGFADLLEIGDTSRPDIFALAIAAPALLHRDVIEVDARATASGEIVARTDFALLRSELERVRAQGIDSLAILVIGGHRRPELEDEIAALARDCGFAHAVCSHALSSEIGALARGDSAVVDAYTTPLMRSYLDGLARALPGSTVRVMCSSGALAPAERVGGRDAILSGPAGGVVAVAAIAEARGLAGAIGFDMGGTSTDVCRIDRGLPERTWESHTAGVRVRAPMLAVHTIAAGGGSICRCDAGRLTVGPGSVGANPGPLCYGRAQAHAASITDMNLVLGRIVDDRFPLPLVRAPVDAALAEIMAELGAQAPASIEHLAEGFFAIAVHAMAEAIRRVSIARGHEVRDDALVVFGGAGGQHACAVASALGIRKVLVHPLAGVLSAWGIGAAPIGWYGEADLGGATLDDDVIARAHAEADTLIARGRDVLRSEGISAPPRVHASVDLRYRGTETALTIAIADAAQLRAGFEARHLAELGWRRDAHAIECTCVRVQLAAAAGLPTLPVAPAIAELPPPRRRAPLFCNGRWHDAAIFDRESLGPGPTLHGPALVLDDIGTLVVEPGWSLTVAADGTLELGTDGVAQHRDTHVEVDPIALEIFAHRFMAIAEQMGVVLRRTALSTNIRERLDFSCAVFDAKAGLVANAPHLPVHLGAMGESVAAVARLHPDAAPGDVFATNDPSAGGSHLPDITVVTPVFTGDALRFWVASRGHHADVGGITPGSMPPHATRLDEEGVVLRALPIVRGDRLCEAELRAALGAGVWPARRPDENLADLQAQIAANKTGELLLRELCTQQGLAVVEAYMGHVQDHAARAVEAAIARLPLERADFLDTTDDGVTIAVALQRRGSTLRIDFTGTSPAQPTNLNAPRAVTVAAVLYVLRTLVGEPIPLNRGCLRAVELVIPPGSLLDPPPDAAVAGGNVETSQRVVDVLLAALGLKAASCGTMSNLTLGDSGFGYYETIAGGEGASDGHAGRSAVQTHMTNTRITDPEVLEARFPVRVIRFAVRRGSGGDGRSRGGDGVVRELELLAPLTVSILSDRRVRAPFGLAGGAAAAPGRNEIAGHEEPGRCSVLAEAGARVRIETPGGGGFGVC
ncbi:MAG TPA: hydantoinase B/oxoprolinase family protein [Nannocystaceae bacterium]|nr:hydantoinase B/oxoprolinase family protein [Nannocystaceae bacterium]